MAFVLAWMAFVSASILAPWVLIYSCMDFMSSSICSIFAGDLQSNRSMNPIRPLLT
jgi:hypothetical protein